MGTGRGGGEDTVPTEEMEGIDLLESMYGG
jgi:hypothetical protein